MSNKKFTILVCLGFVLLVSFSLFMVYDFYNQIKISDNKILEENSKKSVIQEVTFIEDSTKSVFDTDLTLKKIEINSNNNLDNLKELNQDIVSKYENYIFHKLYMGKYEEIDKYIQEIIAEYNILNSNFRDFQLLLAEIKNFYNWGNLSSDIKFNIIKKLKSPKLLLYAYFSLSIEEQNELIIDKNSCILFEKPIYNANFKYIEHDKASIYSEMNINESFFVVPENIDGFKIKFILNEIEYVLYYIVYQDTNLIDIVSVKNKGNAEIVSFKYYFN